MAPGVPVANPESDDEIHDGQQGALDKKHKSNAHIGKHGQRKSTTAIFQHQLIQCIQHQREKDHAVEQIEYRVDNLYSRKSIQKRANHCAFLIPHILTDIQIRGHSGSGKLQNQNPHCHIRNPALRNQKCRPGKRTEDPNAESSAKLGADVDIPVPEHLSRAHSPIHQLVIRQRFCVKILAKRQYATIGKRMRQERTCCAKKVQQEYGKPYSPVFLFIH